MAGWTPVTLKERTAHFLSCNLIVVELATILPILLTFEVPTSVTGEVKLLQGTKSDNSVVFFHAVTISSIFYALLTVHLSIFISVINQLDAQTFVLQ